MIKYFLLFIFPTFILFSQDISLSDDLLINNKWGPEDTYVGYNLVLNKNGTYKIAWSGVSDGEEINGRYTINDNSLILKITDIHLQEYLPKELCISETIWKLAQDSTSIFTSIKLVSNTKYTFWCRTSHVMPGSIRIVDGFEIEIVEYKTYALNENTRVRKGPSTTYEYSSFIIFDNPPSQSQIELPFLPKDYKITVIGRTKEKVQIGNMSDYWYYCDTNLSPVEVGLRFGWVFGGLINK